MTTGTLTFEVQIMVQKDLAAVSKLSARIEAAINAVEGVDSSVQVDDDLDDDDE